jgi:uridylate kinase
MTVDPVRTVVLKAGGNVLNPRDSGLIDGDFLRTLLRFVEVHLLQSYERVVLVPGGIGCELFLQWGRLEGCTEPELDEIGCALINISASIINRAAISNLVDRSVISPTVPKTLDALSQALDKYRLTVAGCAIAHALTSDSLAASIAEHTSADLIFVKNSQPFNGELSFYQDETRSVLKLERMMTYHSSMNEMERAGHHPSLDHLSLRIIRRAHLFCRVLLKDAIVAWRPGKEISGITIHYDS